MLAVACGLKPYQDTGAGKSTLSRLQLGAKDSPDRYKKLGADEEKLKRLLVEIFLASHHTAPEPPVGEVSANIQGLQVGDP